MKFLKAIREKAGLSQKKLAEKLGVDENTVWRWEAGRAYPSVDLGKQIAELLGVSVDDLLRGPAEKRWEVRVILEEPKEVDVMNLTKDAPNEALVEIGTHKIAVKIVGDVENESELDNLLAEVKEKALDGLGLKRKWREAAAQ